MKARKVRLTPRSVYSAFFFARSCRHAAVVDLEQGGTCAEVRRDMIMCSAVSLRMRDQGSSDRLPTDRPPDTRRRAGAAARGRASAGAGAGAARRGRGRGGGARFDVGDHVVLRDPSRHAGARQWSRCRVRARRRSCAPAASSCGAGAPRAVSAPPLDGRRRGRWPPGSGAGAGAGGGGGRSGSAAPAAGAGARSGAAGAGAPGQQRPRRPRSRSARRRPGRQPSGLPAPGSRPGRPRSAPGSRRRPCRWRSRRSVRHA